MTPPTHLVSGYWIYKLSENICEQGGTPLLSVALLGSMAPDIDGLFGKQMNNHRNTVFHTPLFWSSLFVILGISAKLFEQSNLIPYLFAFSVGALTHLLLDWFSARTGGVRFFWPFSQKSYSLFATKPEKGNLPVLSNNKHLVIRFCKFYLENKFLVISEVCIILSPLLVYLPFHI